MSVKSKKSSKAIDRPIDAGMLKRADEIALRYQIILACEEGHWYGRGLELPHVFGDGRTANQCIENTREALTGAVAYLLEEGRRPPSPAMAGARTAQVNIRLTPEKRALLETTSRQKGIFRPLGFRPRRGHGNGKVKGGRVPPCVPGRVFVLLPANTPGLQTGRRRAAKG